MLIATVMVSLRFSTALHTLMLLAYAKADAPERALSSTFLAGSIGANPVVVRRVLGDLCRAGLLETRNGAKGGAWLARPAARIKISEVYLALNEVPAIGFRPRSNAGCPVGDSAPGVIENLIQGMEKAVVTELSHVTLAQLAARLKKTA